MILQLSEVRYVVETDGERLVVLSNASFMVDSARLVAITGPSGSGKSTFLAIAGGLLSPTEGQVKFGHCSLYALSQRDLALTRLKSFGWVMQRPILLSGVTAEENIALPARALGIAQATAKKRAKQLLDEVGLSNKALVQSHLLSGGEAARVAICRALINSPAVLFADEPTASLDARTAVEIGSMLREMCGSHNCTVIMVTHDERLAKLAHTQLHLVNGHLEKK